MTLNDIVKKSANLIIYNTNNYNLELRMKTFEIINLCLNNNIKFELTEEDFVKIIDLYYELHHKYDFNYFKKIANNSSSNLDYNKVFKKICNI